MRNMEKIFFGFLVMTIICSVSASDKISDEDGFQLRFDRQSKQPKRTDESIKKKKEQQKQKDTEAVTNSKLTGPLTNVLTTHQAKEEAMKNILQNTPLELKQLTNPLNIDILTSHGYSYPSQGYSPLQDLSMANHGFFYRYHPLDQIKNKLPIPLHQQQPELLNGQQSFPNAYAPNFLDYNFAIPQQIHLSAQQIRYPAYSISLMGLEDFPFRQPDIHSEIRKIPSNYPNIFFYPEQLPDTEQTLTQFNHPLVPQQPLPFDPVLNNIDFGVPLQNNINNKPFGLNGLILGFEGNKRSLV